MERQEQLPPELQEALTAYEIAMRDGGQREQQVTYDNLVRMQAEIGGAAVVAFFSTETEPPEQQAS